MQENYEEEVKINKNAVYIYATNVLWVQKETLQFHVPDENSGIMANAFSTALHHH